MPVSSGIPQTGTTSTTTTANEYWIGIIAASPTVADITGHSNSFTELSEGASAPDYTTAKKEVSATGTAGFSVSAVGWPSPWFSAGCIITLKETPAASTRRRCGFF